MKKPSLVVPKKWDVQPIPNLLFFQEGPGVRKWQFQDKGVKLLNVSNINDGKLDLTATSIYLTEEEAYGKYSHFLVDAGDLVIGSSGIVVENFHNKIAFVKEEHLPLCMNTSTVRFKTLNNDVLNLGFFRIFLGTNYFKNQLKKLITGSAQLNFGPSHLKKIMVPLPPIKDQIRIASLLDRVETLITTRKNNLQELNNFLKSIFLEMFGEYLKNEESYMPITNIADFIDYRGKTPPRVNKGIPLINAKCVRQGYFDDTRIDYIEESTYKKIMTRGLPKAGDVLFTTEGATMGFTCRIPKDYQNFAVGQRLITLQCKNGYSPIVLDFVLNHPHIQKKISNRKSGSAALGIRAAEFAKIALPQPPKNLHEKFTKIVEKVESLKKVYSENLIILKNLYEVLSQKAFKGELDLSRIPIPKEIRQSVQQQTVISDELVSTDEIESADTVPIFDQDLHEKLLEGYLEKFLQEQDSYEFRVEEFIQENIHIFEEYLGEESQRSNLDDYDMIKDQLFNLIKEGKIEQTFVENEDEITDSEIRLKVKG